MAVLSLEKSSDLGLLRSIPNKSRAHVRKDGACDYGPQMGRIKPSHDTCAEGLVAGFHPDRVHFPLSVQQDEDSCDGVRLRILL